MGTVRRKGGMRAGGHSARIADIAPNLTSKVHWPDACLYPANVRRAASIGSLFFYAW
jgi:hypothetical protein